MYSQNAALGLDRWLTINKLLLKTTALTALVVVTLCGCTKSPKSFEQMSGDEQLNYLRAQADSAMLVQATNAVPNIHAVIEENAVTFSGSVEEWRGWVRVDYTDASGGIQETNILMAFLSTSDGRLFSCVPSRPGSGSALIDIQ